MADTIVKIKKGMCNWNECKHITLSDYKRSKR